MGCRRTRASHGRSNMGSAYAPTSNGETAATRLSCGRPLRVAARAREQLLERRGAGADLHRRPEEAGRAALVEAADELEARPGGRVVAVVGLSGGPGQVPPVEHDLVDGDQSADLSRQVH